VFIARNAALTHRFSTNLRRYSFNSKRECEFFFKKKDRGALPRTPLLFWEKRSKKLTFLGGELYEQNYWD
jgi:hypothetical protein